ncbi:MULTISPECIES: XkdX family protein [Clostridium]|nr:XkdX family protein [Clostridium sp. LY3-2]MCR6515796.1 XkdX family protein [Clostridium sp. LY3-2]
MDFWKLFWSYTADMDMLRQAVKTEKNVYGDITPEEFKEITGEDF